jgi:hypothetical protein
MTKPETSCTNGRFLGNQLNVKIREIEGGQPSSQKLSLKGLDWTGMAQSGPSQDLQSQSGNKICVDYAQKSLQWASASSCA